MSDGPERAVAQAIDRLERDRAVGARAVKIDTQAPLGMRLERRRADRLAGLGAAQVDHVPAAALGAEVVIESDHAVNFGARQVELIGDQTDRVRRHEPEGILHRVQNRQQGARQLLAVGAGTQHRLLFLGAQRGGSLHFMGITRRSLAMRYPGRLRGVMA